jgi:serine/threonine protein phosphatase PrpC
MSAGAYANSIIGHYRLLDFVGAGGMGEVYRAAHVRTGEIVAVKLLLNAQGADMLQRFRNEAHIHAALRHRNIAAMREFIADGATPAIVMEYIDGDSLDQRIRHTGSVSTREALQLFAPVVDAVAYMHQRGVLHRDIKATNVKIARDGSPRLLDFGIAKSAQSPKLTAEGAVIGTWHYLSPEQLQTGIAESRSDVWALGVLLYEMLTGRLPFEGGGVVQLTERILAAEYLPASRTHRSVPPDLDRVIARCLTVRLDKRYQTARELLSDVQAINPSGSTPRHAMRASVPAVVETPVRPSPIAAMIRHMVAMSAPLGVLREVSRRPIVTPVVAVALAAAVGVLAYTLTARQGDQRGAMPQADSVSVTPTPSVFDYAPTKITDSQTVSVKTLEQPADVWIDGRNVGTTPYTVTRPIGSEVQLLLKREGYRDSLVKFPVLIGKPEYSYQLEPIVREEFSEGVEDRDIAQYLDRSRSAPPSKPSKPLDHPPLALAGVAMMLRRLFGKADVAHTPGLKSTQELSVVHDASATPSPLHSVSGLATDVGCVRTGNEDAIRVVRPTTADQLERVGVLTVVCDGMGGHEGGEIASQLAIDTIVGHCSQDATNPTASLARSVEQANRVVFEAAQRTEQLRGMGTTCTALLVIGSHAYCAHVGDSRLYLIRDRDIFLMTEDHSEVMELVRRGVLSRDEARTHPDKNVILRALGVRREVHVASWPHPFRVRAGDHFLVCSDGLHDLVEDADILRAVLTHDTQAACDHLVALARDHGGFDNISVAILAMAPSPQASSPVKATRVAQVVA